MPCHLLQMEQDLEYPLTFWERTSTTRWGRYISEIEKAVILQAHQYAGVPGTALEVGCEGGRWSHLLAGLGWTMICTDVNREVLDICQQRVPDAECRLVKPDDTALPCNTGSIDLLLCMEVRPVIESEWFLSEAHRVLGECGVVTGVAWNRYSLRGLRARLMNALRGANDPFYQRSYPLWKHNLRKQGFQMLYERGLCWFPFRRDSNSALIPICARIERWIGLFRLISLSPWIAFIAQKQSVQTTNG